MLHYSVRVYEPLRLAKCESNLFLLHL